jgi:hypothetical protein
MAMVTGLALAVALESYYQPIQHNLPDVTLKYIFDMQ